MINVFVRKRCQYEGGGALKTLRLHDTTAGFELYCITVKVISSPHLRGLSSSVHGSEVCLACLLPRHLTCLNMFPRQGNDLMTYAMYSIDLWKNKMMLRRLR